jgi:hypothetical protein
MAELRGDSHAILIAKNRHGARLQIEAKLTDRGGAVNSHRFMI